MGELNENTQLHIALGVWVAFADGDVLLVELAQIIEILSKQLPDFDQEEGKDISQFWYSKLANNFQKAEDDLITMVKNCKDSPDLKQSLVRLAEKVVVADRVLKDQEEQALAKIKSWF